MLYVPQGCSRGQISSSVQRTEQVGIQASFHVNDNAKIISAKEL